MKKAAVFILAVILCLTLVSCKGKGAEEVTTEAVSEAVSTETASGENTSEAESISEKTSEQPAEKETESNAEKYTMEVYSDSMSFRVEKSQKVGEVYNMLSALTYEECEDVDMAGGTGVYFYDKEGNELESFFIKDNYLKLNGLPETYKITNSDFDYKAFKAQLLETVGNDLGIDG